MVGLEGFYTQNCIGTETESKTGLNQRLKISSEDEYKYYTFKRIYNCEYFSNTMYF